MAKYDDCDWKELPEDVQKAAEALGYNKKMWDKTKNLPSVMSTLRIYLPSSRSMRKNWVMIKRVGIMDRESEINHKQQNTA